MDNKLKLAITTFVQIVIFMIASACLHFYNLYTLWQDGHHTQVYITGG